jgi:hypothetical protein
VGTDDVETFQFMLREAFSHPAAAAE